jgi:hypothetical protein
MVGKARRRRKEGVVDFEETETLVGREVVIYGHMGVGLQVDNKLGGLVNLVN